MTPLDRGRIAAIVMVPANLAAGMELVAKVRHLLQEQDPTADYVAEPLAEGSASEVPDGFEGFRIVRTVSLGDRIGVTVERQVIVDPPVGEGRPDNA